MSARLMFRSGYWTIIDEQSATIAQFRIGDQIRTKNKEYTVKEIIYREDGAYLGLYDGRWDFLYKMAVDTLRDIEVLGNERRKGKA